MWHLEQGWVLLALPLPWFGYRWLPAWRAPRPALRVPFFQQLAKALGQPPASAAAYSLRWQLCFSLMIWALVVLACARPVWLDNPMEVSRPARAVLLAVDLSESMQTRDFAGPDGRALDRLGAVRQVLYPFILSRSQDRLGLEVFGSKAFVQAPLTLDHDSLRQLLDDLAVGMAGPDTALGDAIGLAVGLLERTGEPEKLVVLLSDGRDTASRLELRQAAALARRHGVVVHTIALGDRRAEGEGQADSASLQAIARITGGTSQHADDRLALQQAWASLDRQIARDVRVLSLQPQRELFWLPLAAALMLGLANASLALRRSGRGGVDGS